MCWLLSRVQLCDPMDYSQSDSSVHEIFPSQNTRVDCHFLLQGAISGIKPMSAVSPALLADFLPTESSGKPEYWWVALPTSKGSSQPRDQTEVSRIADGFLTIWTTREGHVRSYTWIFLQPGGVGAPNPTLFEVYILKIYIYMHIHTYRASRMAQC